jgi:hypothetical protein
MTDSAFDDQSFLEDLPEDQLFEVEEQTASPEPKPQSSRPFRRFNEEDMFGEKPEEEDPLYPDIMQPKQGTAVIKRPFPWFIDIFLYPVNRTGIINLIVTFGVPLLLIALTAGSIALAKVAPLLIFVAVILALSALMTTLVMCLYFGWYVTECVRGSAEGLIRAPDTIGQTPGMMELFALCFQVVLCGMVFLGMSWSFGATFMPPYWAQLILDTALALLLPMTLLNIIFVDSIRGLNPLINIKLIGITFLPYCYMAIPLYLAHKGLFWACLKLQSPVGLITLTLCEVYGAMVSAHVLGRFAWKQQDKLTWE